MFTSTGIWELFHGGRDPGTASILILYYLCPLGACARSILVYHHGDVRVTTLFRACTDRRVLNNCDPQRRVLLRYWGAPRFFLQGSSIWELKTSSKNCIGEKQMTDTYRMTKSHGLARYTTRIMQKNDVSDDFGLRSVFSRSENISHENCYLSLSL